MSDIFQWEDRQRSEKQKAAKSVAGTEQKRLRGTDVVIPALVLEVKVKLESHARIDAVIVTEHRNLSTFGIDNVLIVMVRRSPLARILLICSLDWRFSIHGDQGVPAPLVES